MIYIQKKKREERKKEKERKKKKKRKGKNGWSTQQSQSTVIREPRCHCCQMRLIYHTLPLFLLLLLSRVFLPSLSLFLSLFLSLSLSLSLSLYCFLLVHFRLLVVGE